MDMDINMDMAKFNWFDYHNFYGYVASKPSYKRFVEVGVWQGHSISFLAQLLKGRPGVEIYAVDLFENREDEWDNPEVTEYLPKIPQIYENNLTKTDTRHMIKDIPGCSWEMADKFEDSSLDFVYIDAAHDYDSVKKDMIAWGPKVKPTGIFAGHDALCPGVSKNLMEVFNPEYVKMFVGNVWYLENGEWL